MTSENRSVRVSDEEEGSVAKFSEENGITEDQTRDLILKWGNDRSILVAEASKLAAGSPT